MAKTITREEYKKRAEIERTRLIKSVKGKTSKEVMDAALREGWLSNPVYGEILFENCTDIGVFVTSLKTILKAISF